MKKTIAKARKSFNPYFNGYSTLTDEESFDLKAVEASFNPYFNGYSTLTQKKIFGKKQCGMKSFNPYFNGYSTLTCSWLFGIPNQIIVSILILMDTLL